MPYITKEQRHSLCYTCDYLPNTSGELNYWFTCGILDYLWTKNVSDGNLTYQTINDILGALEGAKQEFYRRVVVPYEEEKIKQNGDIPGYGGR